MLEKCVIKTCNTMKAGDGVSLHSLPSDSQVQREWFRAILNGTGQTVFSEDDVICSKHFSNDSFMIAKGKLVLSPDAVPSQFLDDDEPDIKRIKTEKEEEDIFCSVFSCTNTLSYTEDKRHVAYLPFPKDPTLAAKWKTFCNTTDNDVEDSFVCSDHFVPSDFTPITGNGGLVIGKTLKPTAVPSVYKKENVSEECDELDIIVDTSSMGIDCDSDTYGNYSGSGERRSNDKFCVIQKCQSRTENIADIDYYPAPTQINTRRTWLKLIQTHTKQGDIPQNSFICSLHFASDCFRTNQQTKKKTLFPNAVPSIFPTPRADKDDFPPISVKDLMDPECGKKFYEWSIKNYQEQKRTIQFLRERCLLQAKRIAKLAQSVDDFKAKRYVSDEANVALQNLFDKIVDAQFDVL